MGAEAGDTQGTETAEGAGKAAAGFPEKGENAKRERGSRGAG